MQLATTYPDVDDDEASQCESQSGGFRAMRSDAQAVPR